MTSCAMKAGSHSLNSGTLVTRSRYIQIAMSCEEEGRGKDKCVFARLMVRSTKAVSSGGRGARRVSLRASGFG
jgi:hypothetical protein